MASNYLAIADGAICHIAQSKILLRGKPRLCLESYIFSEYFECLDPDALLISLDAK